MRDLPSLALREKPITGRAPRAQLLAQADGTGHSRGAQVSLTFNLGPVRLAAEEQKKTQQAVAQARD